jgi:uncharacterized protein YbcI
MQKLEAPSRGEIAASISRAVVRVLHDHTGRGPTKARTEFGANLVTVLLADTLTKGEQNLVSSGKGELVLEVRHEFQAAMRGDLTDAVETITGRTVLAFMSQNHIAPDLAVETFVLTPSDSADELVDDGPAAAIARDERR